MEFRVLILFFLLILAACENQMNIKSISMEMVFPCEIKDNITYHVQEIVKDKILTVTIIALNSENEPIYGFKSEEDVFVSCNFPSDLKNKVGYQIKVTAKTYTFEDGLNIRIAPIEIITYELV